MKKSVSLLLTLFLITSCSESVCLAASGEIDAEEYAVYSALTGILMEKKHSRGPVELVVINEQTTPIREAHYLSGMSLKETYEDYKSKNTQPYPLKSLFNLQARYVFASYEEVRRLNSREFAGRYPGALGSLIFSRAGLNREKTDALVYVQRVCGFSCAEASGYSLTKKDGKWKIRKQRFLWMT